MTVNSLSDLSGRVSRNFTNIRTAVDVAESDIQLAISEFQAALQAAQAGISRAAGILINNPAATPAQGNAVIAANRAVAQLEQQGQAAAAQGNAQDVVNVAAQLAAIAAAAPQPAPAQPAPAPAVAPAAPAQPAPAPATPPAQLVQNQYNWYAPQQGHVAPARGSDQWGQRTEEAVTSHEGRLSAVERFLSRRQDGTFAFTGNGGQGPDWQLGAIVGFIVWIIVWIISSAVFHADIVQGAMIGGSIALAAAGLTAFIAARRTSNNN